MGHDLDSSRPKSSRQKSLESSYADGFGQVD